jgi:hypothetical protein
MLPADGRLLSNLQEEVARLQARNAVLRESLAAAGAASELGSKLTIIITTSPIQVPPRVTAICHKD